VTETSTQRKSGDFQFSQIDCFDYAEAIYDPEIWDTPGFTLVLSWLAQKWQQRWG